MSEQREWEDIQSRLAFQEQTLTELNDVIARQAEQIARLEQQMHALAGKYRDLREAVEERPDGVGNTLDERPPHY
ncbi:SlyX family protein [Marinimicrobium agarilyticum]|uniref:SlyX family protein n=1 Tax=Marinimicrobium agarilyticum TaxID=306546 RepID=UPI0003F72CEA|nr:SlyX family protein [Marinimicrobium agarilyticum]